MRDARKLGSEDRGAATVATIAGVAIIIMAMGSLVPLCIGVTVRHSVAAAADAAALAASDAAMGALPGEPCERAEKTAFINKAELTRCEVNTSTASATVTARRSFFGVELAVRARAEPRSATKLDDPAAPHNHRVRREPTRQ